MWPTSTWLRLRCCLFEIFKILNLWESSFRPEICNLYNQKITRNQNLVWLTFYVSDSPLREEHNSVAPKECWSNAMIGLSWCVEGVLSYLLELRREMDNFGNKMFKSRTQLGIQPSNDSRISTYGLISYEKTRIQDFLGIQNSLFGLAFS